MNRLGISLSALFQVLVICSMPALAQQSTTVIVQHAKGKTEQKINEKIDRAIDGVFNMKIGGGRRNDADPVNQESNVPGQAGQATQPAMAGSTSDTVPSWKLYSKFDFVSGDKVIFYEDFESVATGDFPANVNTNASGEVKQIEGRPGKWLSLTQNGSFIPEAIGVLPDNFTLEMNVAIIGDPGNNQSGLGFQFDTNPETLMDYHFAIASFVTMQPAGYLATVNIVRQEAEPVRNEIKMDGWRQDIAPFARLSFWRQKSRLRVYVNETKLLDVPRFFPEEKPYRLAIFRDFFGDCDLLLTEIKLAAGAPDTRNKLLSSGTFSTTGILFDFQKATLRPESYGVLKEISAVLKEDPSLKLMIVGHTSNDGDAAANLVLSKQRAASVKQALISAFGISADRLQTDGKGGAEPADPGSTVAAKANNRRVEFKKL